MARNGKRMSAHARDLVGLPPGKDRRGLAATKGPLAAGPARLRFEKSLAEAVAGNRASLKRLGGLAAEMIAETLRRAAPSRLGPTLGNASDGDLLEELSERGGAAGALGEAGLLALRKTADYDDGLSRDRYFPLGLASFAQMIHVKSERLLSLARNQRETNFESARDTALDVANYASFLADWLKRSNRVRP